MVLLFPVIIATQLIAVSVAIGQNDKPNWAAIERAWRTRQDRIRTAMFQCTERHTTMRGKEAVIPHSADPARVIPPHDLTHERIYEITVSGDRIRYRRSGTFFDNEAQDYIHLDYVSVFDGKEGRNLLDRDSPQLFKLGFVRTGNISDEGNDHYQPMVLYVRGLLSALTGMDLAQWKVAPREEYVNNRRCWILEKVSLSGEGTPSTQERYWLDAEQQFVVLKSELTHLGRLLRQVDIEYQVDSEYGVVPSAWRLGLVGFESGTITRAFDAVVNEYAINASIPDETFKVTFPPGTIVNDSRGPERSKYVVDRHGRNRPVTPDLYAQLPADALQGLDGGRWPLFSLPVVGVLLGLAILIIVVQLWLRRSSA